MQWKEARGRVALSLRLLFLLGSHSECAWIFWPWHSDRCTCFITFPFLPFVSCAFFLVFCARFRSVPSHPPLSHFVCVCYLADVLVCLRYCRSPGGCWAVCVFVCVRQLLMLRCARALYWSLWMVGLKTYTSSTHRERAQWNPVIKTTHTPAYRQSMQCVRED